MIYQLYTDGAARGNPGMSGAGAVLFKGNKQLQTLSKFLGKKKTNNEAEYEALILGLEMALAQGVSSVEVFMDSELIVNQITGKFKIKKAHLQVLARGAKELVQKFEEIKFTHIKRGLNKLADEQANLAIDDFELMRKLK